MTTLHVFDTIDPASGGPIESFRRWGDVLAGRGAGCEVVSLDRPDSGLDKGFPFKLTMLGDASSKRGRAFGEAYRYSPRLVPWLRANRDRFDCVTAHSMWTYSTLGVARGLRDGHTPFLVFAHGMMDPYFRHAYPLKHIKKQAYWSLWLGRAMEEATTVLFTAEEERVLARGSFRGHRGYRETVIGFGTADAPGATPAQRAAFHAHCPAAAGRRILLFLGRIHPKKGCDMLIEAFAALAAAHPDVDIVMAGPDATGWRATLEPLAEGLGVGDRIHWPGMLSGDAKWGAFRAAEAFVLPSHQENFGIAVAEALACALPVLITDKVNIWQEIVAAGAGLAGEDTAADTAAQLARFLAMGADERQAMAAAARALFTERFDVETTALSILDAIIAAGRTRPAAENRHAS